MSLDGGIPGALNGDGVPTASPSRRSSISLQATATLNAGLQREPPSRGSASPLSFRNRSPSTGRRRSQILANLHIADPSVPAPGEMVADDQPSNYQPNIPHPVTASPRLIASGVPHHTRTPSLGELHQELENEQEFHVNRLLAQIRQLQEQLQRQQQQNQSAVLGDETSDRSAPLTISTSSPQPLAAYPSSGSLPRSPVFPRSSFDLARADLRHRSRTPSRNASPRLRSASISADSGEPWALGGRDESAFYQAETQMLIRENQMLRHRIRELERQLSEMQGNNTSVTHEPSHSSHLNHSVSASDEDSASQTPVAASEEDSARQTLAAASQSSAVKAD
ncbi:hypothetical protein N657DRAFT_654541 [Parathielavia appendiculata]|uniref:Uncharacterized protein n=1 Tax=Parathielavia appendiculata TaxID=2587402 RepID=A0AAN6Z6K1_9PEZI|nr:hypothetical protein N657DRAFT_654541 [Parathielavia appendiculata]